MPGNNSKAIVTLAIGPDYLEQYQRFCEPNWRQYASRWGYDLICLETALDTSERASKRSPAWQKCLILSQEFSRNYERIVWVDSDVFINVASAPDITACVPVDKVGAVELFSSPTPGLYTECQRRMYDYWDTLYGPVAIENYTAHEYYLKWGLPYGFDYAANTGVLVLSPEHHRDLLEEVYFNYEEKSGGGRGVWHMEQRPLSWELMKANAIHWLDLRFNVNWWELQFLYYPFLVEVPSRDLTARIKRRLRRAVGDTPARRLRQQCINAAFLSSYFLHITGGLEETGKAAELIDFDASSWRSWVRS